ncbi:WD40 repeat-like protein [Massarina eburnea CBS 473.64]|uniref:WD40 repeat-like protein n=1 Tax=Massarina eburnea CBS 473.64 TaxID=1395130 RepID=A0A6A6SEG0_9PLEO|nr:WD40 repeat-like protein [Massarina eburnea CBS 473.64]
MADLNDSPKLKRKREGAEAQRKKAKTQKKSLAANGEVETASAQTATATPTPQRLVVNGTPNGAIDAPSSAKQPGNDAVVAVVAADAEVEAKKLRKQQKKERKKDKLSNQWSISNPQGGWFLPQDPIFSADEKYLLLPKSNALEVYSAESSLLARTLPVVASSVILAAALSSTESSRIYVTDSLGIVTLWDWTDGSKIGRWGIGANVRHLAVAKQVDANQDLLFAHEAGNRHNIVIHALRTKRDAPLETESKRILKASEPITGIQVLLQGKVVVASTANRILIGKRTKLQKKSLQDYEYTWREFETSKPITTFSAYIRIPESETRKNPQLDPKDHLDLAVGHEDGVIFLFEDIIPLFVAIERSQKEGTGKTIGPESLRPKRLHWHREAVGSVKWSLDGNYLISGGDETVLTIWQLATGKQQHLPHLSAAIEKIVLSPSGTSYGISLANNSVIVLSTSELNAKTNVVGIQSRRVDSEQLPRESKLEDYDFKIFNQVPLVVNPKHNNQVIFATPSSQPRGNHPGLLPAPYAQTFDIANSRPISRQALTRNNVTDPNMAPNGGKIQEPNVKLIQISHDGAWLATVDEWLPSPADMGHIEEGEFAFNEEERLFRRQVYLKFWRWDEKNAEWVLDARIDAPHFFENVSGHAEVFDLVADPSGTGFATVGKDRFVRLWQPKTRTRDGTVVRGADRTQGFVTWSLVSSVKLADKLDITDAKQVLHESFPLRVTRLAFSADGSVLAAGVSWASDSDSGVIHIIDTDTGVIRRSITECDAAALSGLGIVGRYLVVVSTSVSVWDIVTDQLVHCTPIRTDGVSSIDRVELVRLAVNEEDGTFAVAAPRFEKNPASNSRDSKALRGSTTVSIFEPSQAKARWTGYISDITLALAPANGGRGYIALDASSTIHVISPKSSALQFSTPPPESVPRLITDRVDADAVENEIETESSNGTALQFDASEELLRISENDKPVVRPEQLQQIFDIGPSHTLPPVRDLFDSIVSLYARKPRAGVV